MKVRFISREKYSTGMTYVSEPWKDTIGKDIFIYELYSDKNDDLRSKIKIIDEALDGNKIKHINIINQVLSGVTELIEKENVYDNLSDDEKNIMNKFKELYK